MEINISFCVNKCYFNIGFEVCCYSILNKWNLLKSNHKVMHTYVHLYWLSWAEPLRVDSVYHVCLQVTEGISGNFKLLDNLFPSLFCGLVHLFSCTYLSPWKDDVCALIGNKGKYKEVLWSPCLTLWCMVWERVYLHLSYSHFFHFSSCLIPLKSLENISWVTSHSHCHLCPP